MTDTCDTYDELIKVSNERVVSGLRISKVASNGGCPKIIKLN